MYTKKIVFSGILAGIVISVISYAVSFLAQKAFSFNVLELAGMRSINDPICSLFFLYPFVLGIAMAFVYPYFSKPFSGNYLRKGRMFGMAVWVIAGIPSAFLVFSSMSYPIGFTVNSVIGSLLYMTGAGITIAKIME